MMSTANKTVGAVIQARLGSSRLPGKVMESIGGKPLLHQLVQRVQKAKTLAGVCIATSTTSENDCIEHLASGMGVPCFRGSEENVLERVVGAAESFGFEVVLRLTGDNPLYDAELIDAMVTFYHNSDYDLVANSAMDYSESWQESRTFPLGLGIQICSLELLQERLTSEPDQAEREHVTLGIIGDAKKYRLGAFPAMGSFAIANRPQYRLTVDTPEDLELIRRIFGELGQKDSLFPLKDVIDLLDCRPDLAAINSDIAQVNESSPAGS